MPVTSRVEIPDEVSAFYDKNLLLRVTSLLVHTNFAQVRDLPRNAGTSTIKFRRYGNLAAATTPLSEGVTPAGKSLSVTDITATVLQYGDFITITDVLQYSSPDAILTETGDLLGDQAGDTLDQLTRDIINAGTVVARVNARAARINIVAGDVLVVANFNTALTTLKAAKARKLTTMMDASTGINTTPINAGFVCIVHTELSQTIKGFTGFVGVEKYASKQNIMEGEFGYYNDIRFIESTNAKVFTGLGGGGIDVYTAVVFGQHAYGISRISGESMKNIIKPLGSAGSADPLDQRATSGWKATFVAKILNDDFMYRIECAKV